MKNKLLIVGGIALGAAVLTTAVFYYLLAGRMGGSDEGPTKSVVVASQDLPRGTQLNKEHLAVDSRPVADVPADSYEAIEDLEGKFVINSVSAGRPITKNLLPGPGVNGLAAAIPQGMRAVTLHVAEYSGVNDIVRPGDRIDVLAASDYGRNSRNKPTVETVLENIEVLATDRERAQKDRRISPTVTVLIAEDAVEPAALADQNYVIRLALRNPIEDGMELTDGDAQQAASSTAPETETSVPPASPQPATEQSPPARAGVGANR